ncbi:hypothetical protein DUNSADRAFT_5267 [Dunaliella salina]|uniref:Uncharacterized protein n=1 Tax=Dunaliella salina TaxID=3046 RepID=A0ABQ7FUF1_DUNSA|nr:hypothetical protein DUNSADRAFT_5267 [Dunaliella salina]|eukprot:KAF5826037.1 hypothetical protein DUNSADRAFT_5267 [Dunaliella salina]
MVLRDCIQEVPYVSIKEKYAIDLAGIRGLQDNCAKTAGMVTKFCMELGWDDMAQLTSKFQGRINLGIKAELTELANVQGIRGYRARILFKNGLKTPEDVAAADVEKLADLLSGSKPGSAKQPNRAELKAAHMIHKSATKYCEEKVERLQEQLKALQDGKQNQQFSQPKPRHLSQDAQELIGHLGASDGRDGELGPHAGHPE